MKEAKAIDWSKVDLAKVLATIQTVITVLQQLFPPKPSMRHDGGDCHDDKHELLHAALAAQAESLSKLLELHKGCCEPSEKCFAEGPTQVFGLGGGAVEATCSFDSREEAKAALEKLIGEMSKLSPVYGDVWVASAVFGVGLKLKVTKEQIADDSNWK